MLSTFYRENHTTAPESDPRLLVAKGSRDTRRYSGGTYSTIGWGEISRLVDEPERSEKDQARFVILSTYVERDARSHDPQRDNGTFYGLAIDIDEGSPSLDAVVAAVRAVCGDAQAEVYTTSSTTAEVQKWRVLIPLAEPISGQDYKDTQEALFALMSAQGIVCDEALARPGQPIYLPHVPPGRRGDDGQPLFYVGHHLEGPRLHLSPDHPILVQRETERRQRAEEAAAQRQRAEERKAQRLEYVEATGDDFDAITHFNETHSIASMLAHYGFEQDPKKPGHWKSPLSTSGSYSTKDEGDYWVTVSSWAQANGVGRVSSKGNGYGDAFSLFVYFDHAGDTRAAIRAYRDEVRPRPIEDIPVVPQPQPAGELRTLADWREEVAKRRLEAIRTPGLHLDRSPTGSGKTYATIEALRQVSSSLTVLPTHANVIERVEEMRGQGIEAVPFPEMSPDNCRNYDEARKAQRLGLIAGAAVCPGCPFSKGCQYRAEVKAAGRADHRVGTHERLRRSSKAAEGVEVIVVDEAPESVLAPSMTAPAKQIAAVDQLARSILNYWWSPADVDQKAFAGDMIAVVEAVNDACKGISGAGVVEVEIPRSSGGTPDNWQRLLHQAIGQVGVAESLRPEALAIITRAAAGELASLRIVTDEVRGNLHHYLVAGWRPRLPATTPVVMLDATGDADDIAAATGRVVEDCTPAGHLEAAQRIEQIPTDITRRTSLDVVANLVDAFLRDHPEVERLGVIGHSVHIKGLIDQAGLGESTRARIVKWCYFGQGPERASNDWHQTCDHILILGTPRANPGDHRRWLAQHGQPEAAAGGGDWGARRWEGRRADGSSVVVEGAGYRDDAWQRAYVAVSQATLHQAIGRGRAILPGGKPVTILSTDATTHQIGQTLRPLPTAQRQTVEVVRDCAVSPIEKPYRENRTNGARTKAVVEALEKQGVSRRAAQRRLAECLESGALTQPARGYYSLPDVQAPVTPATVVAASPPDPIEAPAQVVSGHLDHATTATTTEAPAPDLDAANAALIEAAEERAAIVEYDAGQPRDVAEALALEAVYGRSHTAAEVSQDAVGVDHLAQAAAQEPLVQAAARAGFSGTVRAISRKEDPFRDRHRPKVVPGVCQCGRSEWREVSIHKGASRRVDCAHCDRFGYFSVWYGEPRLAPWQSPPTSVPLDSLEPAADQANGIYGTDDSSGVLSLAAMSSSGWG